MSVRSIDHYNLRASRELLDALKEFYCSVVGLREGPRPDFASAGYWLYAGDKALLHLTETHPNEVRTLGVSTTFDHVAFHCENRQEMEERLKVYGIEVVVDRVPQLAQVQLFVLDPAGNGVELNFSDENA